jgi:FkbM family methyltransferase
MNNNSFIKNIYKGFKKRLVSLFQNPYKEVNINWLKLKYFKHLSAGKLRTHYLFGRPFYFYNPEELLHAFEEIFIGQVYKQQLQNQPYIFDCGANIGLSVIYMKHFYPKAEIVAFEPDKKNFDLLEKNMQSFGYNNVILRNEAVWTENTTLQFSNEGLMSSKIVAGYDHNTKQIKAIRLRDLLIREIDFLKIDIEGAEYVVLNDINDKLHFVKNMFVEYHGTFKRNYEIAELLTIINKSGFNFYIKEATCVYKTPFYRIEKDIRLYDIQLNIFCFRT